jgi:hypothetical protein
MKDVFLEGRCAQIHLNIDEVGIDAEDGRAKGFE